MPTTSNYQLSVRLSSRGASLRLVRETWYNDRPYPKSVLIALEHYSRTDWDANGPRLMTEWVQSLEVLQDGAN